MRHIKQLIMIAIMSIASLEATAVTLRDSHNVQGDFLRLSDFFDGLSVEQDQEIIEAPAVGDSKHYPHAWVQRLAVNFGFTWTPAHQQGITVTRQDVTAFKVDVYALIKEHLAIHAADKLEGNADIVLDASAHYAFRGASTEPKLIECIWANDKKFVAIFDVNGQEKKVSGTLSKMVDVPVLNKIIPAGQTIEHDDIDYKAVPATKVTAYIILDEKDLIGKTLRRHSVKEGDLLSKHDVITPIAIKRGDMVIMRVETPSVVITARGKAQANAGIGDSVQVMNLESKRLVEGVVKDSQTIVIPVAMR